MNIVTMSGLRELVSAPSENCISIFMPTQLVGPDSRQDEIRLRGLVTRAQKLLIAAGMLEEDTHELLRPISTLPLGTEWRMRKQGLAVYRSRERFTTYWLDNPLMEDVFVAPQFFIRPLLPLVAPSIEFFVLALSRNEVRLLKATSNGFERLEPNGFPRNMEKALNLQGSERGEQVHTGMHAHVGKEAGVFHGQGGHRDTIKDEVVEFCQLIDKALSPILKQHPWPLVLAGVEYELALFRRTTHYSQVVDEALHGNFDFVTDQALFDRGLPIARQYYETIRRKPLLKYESMTNRILTSDDLDEILSAARDGKIETLLVDSLAELRRDDARHSSFGMAGSGSRNEDLINIVAAQTLLNGGNVYAAAQDELPSKAPMWAILRY